MFPKGILLSGLCNNCVRFENFSKFKFFGQFWNFSDILQYVMHIVEKLAQIALFLKSVKY